MEYSLVGLAGHRSAARPDEPGRRTSVTTIIRGYSGHSRALGSSHGTSALLTSANESVLMVTPRYWKLRESLGPGGRRRVRAAVDAVVAPVLGSVRATGATTRAAITFDDGPDPQVTPLLLEALAEAGVTCTFFVLVAQARRHPELLGALSAAGHEIARHGDDHRRRAARSRALRRSARREAQDGGEPVPPGRRRCR